MISIGKAVGKRMCGECPVAGAGAPGSGAPRILFLTAFTIDISRFEVHFSCSVWVLRRDSISAHVRYGLRTNLQKHTILRKCFPFLYPSKLDLPLLSLKTDNLAWQLVTRKDGRSKWGLISERQMYDQQLG